MQPQEERVIIERAELAAKTASLEVFLFGQVFDSLPRAEQQRLLRQHLFMKAYLEVLEERIAAFKSFIPLPRAPRRSKRQSTH
jgi:hypothetical protein